MPEYLTTKEHAVILRLKERKIYDLVSSGTIPYTKVTGKLLFARDQIDNWLNQGQQGAADTRPAVFLGSHDPLLEWALRQSNCGLANFFDGSGDGLRRFVDGEGIAAGMHIFDAASQSWNLPAVKLQAGHLPAVLVRFATRSRGLIVRPGEGITKIQDLDGKRYAARPLGTGAQALFDELSAGLDVAKVGSARSESDAAMAVAQLEADAALGLPTIARQYGLDFIPIMDECFDLLIDRKAFFDPPLQSFLKFASSRACQTFATRLGGYDLSSCGTIIWNGP